MAVMLVATAKMYAGDTPSANPYFSKLSTVSPAELPAKSAALVTQADAKNRVESTINVVKAAVGLNPAAAAAIVGAIAKSVPEMASVAAGAAVTLVPDQAVAIARAAAAAAPSEAGKIVETVSRVVPNDYQAVASAVTAVAPGMVTTTANANSSLTPDASPAAPAYHFGPPYVPPSSTPVTINPPVSGGIVPPGGRQYASP